MAIEKLITNHLELWTAAVRPKSSAGRGSNSKLELTGIKKLRELILELAVRGKLVPQDSNDEPASVLLKRIAAEKALLIKSKTIKKTKILPDVTEDELYFELPDGWMWARLNDLGDWGAGATPTRGNPAFYGGDIPWFKSGELNSNYIFESEETVTELALNKSSLRYNSIGDVLVAMYGATIGKTSILGVKATTNQAVCACTPFSGFLNTYLLCLLKAYRPRLVDMGAGGAQPNISREKIIATVIALPPTSEQQRIVQKIEELMALCDQLEQQSEAQLAAHQTLVEALLATLTDSADADELAQNWARLAQHFDTLFTTESSIDTLQQTILQLAVMGKLVPQDPSDEPASALLARITAEKTRLVKEGKIKKTKPLPEISNQEKLFALPKGWKWCRIDNVSMFITSGSRDWAKYYSDFGAKFITMGNLSRGSYSLRMDNIRYVNPPLDGEGSRTKLEEDDLLVSITGDVGNLGLIPSGFGEAYINQHTCLVRFVPMLRNRYFPEFLRSPFAKYQFDAPQRGIKNSFRLGDVGELVISLPPENEQHRIVAKIDELMSLCDQLKTRLQTSQQTQLVLAEALVKGALD